MNRIGLPILPDIHSRPFNRQPNQSINGHSGLCILGDSDDTCEMLHPQLIKEVLAFDIFDADLYVLVEVADHFLEVFAILFSLDLLLGHHSCVDQ